MTTDAVKLIQVGLLRNSACLRCGRREGIRVTGYNLERETRFTVRGPADAAHTRVDLICLCGCSITVEWGP